MAQELIFNTFQSFHWSSPCASKHGVEQNIVLQYVGRRPLVIHLSRHGWKMRPLRNWQLTFQSHYFMTLHTGTYQMNEGEVKRSELTRGEEETCRQKMADGDGRWFGELIS